MTEVAALIRDGKVDLAEQQLHNRRAEAETSADWQFTYGGLMEAKGQADDALAAYRKALAISPQHPAAKFRLAYLLDLYGEEKEAVELYEDLADCTPTPVNVLINLAVIHEDYGRYEEAMHCVQRVLDEYPNHQRARLFAKDIASSMNMLYDEGQERSRAKRSAIMDTPIGEFELTVRARNCLTKMNIHTIGELLCYSEADLLAYKNFGDTSLTEIKTMLSQRGLRLGQLKEENPRQARVPARRPAAEGSPEIHNKFLSEIALSSRARKCLDRLNLMTVGDLVAKTEQELLSVKNFGQTSLDEIKKKLEDLGVTLRKSS